MLGDKNSAPVRLHLRLRRDRVVVASGILPAVATVLTGKVKFGIFKEAIHQDDELTHDGDPCDFGFFCRRPAGADKRL